MKRQLLASVSAIALIAFAGAATAQEKGTAQPQSTSPAQQSAPSASPGGSEMKGGSDVKGGQAQQQRQDQPQRAQEPTQQRENQAQDKKGDQPQRAQDQTSPKSTTQDTKSNQNQSTTGQGAAGASGGASLTSEQRTKISTTIRQSNVRPLTNVNFNISVGAVVPRTVELHPLPPAVIEIYPEWRGYRFVLVGDQIIIIEPSSYKIVTIISV